MNKKSVGLTVLGIVALGLTCRAMYGIDERVTISPTTEMRVRVNPFGCAVEVSDSQLPKTENPITSTYGSGLRGYLDCLSLYNKESR